MEGSKVKIEDRIAMHRRMAEGYRDVYMEKTVKDGATYQWKFAGDATFRSPYFTDDKDISLGGMVVDVAAFVNLEAKAFSAKFPDYGVVESKIWAAENGFAMLVRYEGHMKDGTKMGFCVTELVETNEQGELAHWESHVNGDEFGPFLEAAIGVRGPFQNYIQYLEALTRVVEESGQSV